MEALHHKLGILGPCIVIGADSDKAVNAIWNTSNGMLGSIAKEFTITPIDVCRLDPGGMILDTPFKTLSIDNNKFEIQYSKIPSILWTMSLAQELCEDTLILPQAGFSIIIDKTTYNRLNAELKIMKNSDEYLHAAIDQSEKMFEIEEHTDGFFIDMPRELPGAGRAEEE